MELSPGRELRNRKKQSPTPSPSQTRRSPHSPPGQAGSNVVNGAFHIKSFGNKFEHDSQGKPLDKVMTNNINLNNQSKAYGMLGLNVQTSYHSPNFKNVLVDNLTLNAFSKNFTLSSMKSLDLNSNMNSLIPSTSSTSAPPTVCRQSLSQATSGKRSRKQSSPRRARTASNSPVSRQTELPALWGHNLELTPTSKRKRKRKNNVIVLEDSPVTDFIDLTGDTPENSAEKISRPSRCRNQVLIPNKGSPQPLNKMLTRLAQNSPTVKESRRSPRTVPTLGDCSNSYRDCRSSAGGRGRNCRSNVNEISDSDPDTPRPKRRRQSSPPCKTSSERITRSSPGHKKKFLDQGILPVVHRTSPTKAESNTPSKSLKKSTEISVSPTRSQYAQKDNNKNSPSKMSPNKNGENMPTKNSPKGSPQQTQISLEENGRRISPVCRKLHNSPLKQKQSPANEFIDTFINFVSKSSSFISDKISKTKQNVSCMVGEKTQHVLNMNKNAGERIEDVSSDNGLSESFLIQGINESRKERVFYKMDSSENVVKASGSQFEEKFNEKHRNDAPVKDVKENSSSPIKVNVEPPTPNPADDSNESNFDFDQKLLDPNASHTKSRKIVRGKKLVSRQRKSSGGSRRGSTGKRKRVMLSPCKFQCGQEVLARWYDGLFYLGSVIKVHEKARICFVRFEDDSEYWILFKDLQKGVQDGDLSCCLCQTDVSDKPNEIVLCDNCGLGYHQECHNPNISSDILQPDIEWCCRLCVFAAAVKKGGALKNGPDAKALQKMKQTFPYDINKLTWDAQHKTNVEQCYCYCGGPGNWFLKMLQCCRCRQWFHEACIQCLEYPLMNGDRFYLFVCSHCNTGPEYIKRLDLKWVDVVHLTLYNLTIEGRWNKFYDVDTIVDFIDSNWEMLQVDCLAVDKERLREKVTNALSGYKSRFSVSQKDSRRKSLTVKQGYGLRVRIPPPAPSVMLPLTGQINHEIMMSLKEKGKNLKSFVPSQCTSPVSVPWLNKQRGLEMDVSIAFKKGDKIRRNLLQVVSDNSENSDYQSDSQPNQSTLDLLIPKPKNFDGHNHPFKHFFEQEEEKAYLKRKTEIMNYLYMEYEGDALSRTSIESAFSGIKDDPTTAIPTPPPSVSGNGAVDTKENLRKRKRGSINPEPIRQSKRRRVATDHFNAIYTATIENSVRSGGVSIAQMRNNVCQYFGTADRLRKGEKYNVYGKHVTSDGKTRYLIQWDGLHTK